MAYTLIMRGIIIQAEGEVRVGEGREYAKTEDQN